MHSVLQYLVPKADGWLPSWQLFVAVTAALNSIQTVVTLKLTRRLYCLSANVTTLQARTFAIWTLISAVIRMYAAYNISNKQVYDIAIISYLCAFLHFGSEITIFRTANLFSAVINPVVVSTVSLVWMFTQYDFYVRA